MTQDDIRASIDELKNSVIECNGNAVILSSTASNKNTVALFGEKIDRRTFYQNGSEIGSLGAEFMAKCKCSKKKSRS